MARDDFDRRSADSPHRGGTGGFSETRRVLLIGNQKSAYLQSLKSTCPWSSRTGTAGTGLGAVGQPLLSD